MKKILGIWLLLICLVGSAESFGQSFSTELTGLEESWSLSGSFNTLLSKSSKFSFSNVSRISADYFGKEDLHALLISNLAYSLHRRFKSTLGGISTVRSICSVPFDSGRDSSRGNINLGLPLISTLPGAILSVRHILAYSFNIKLSDQTTNQK